MATIQEVKDIVLNTPVRSSITGAQDELVLDLPLTPPTQTASTALSPRLGFGNVIISRGNFDEAAMGPHGLYINYIGNNPAFEYVRGQPFLVISGTTSSPIGNNAAEIRDLTQSAWTKTNATASFDQLGALAADGLNPLANSASKLVATANGGLAVRAVTAGATTRTFAILIKRLMGTGTISLTGDGGTTTVDVTAQVDAARLLPGGWARVSLTNNILNPSYGIVLGTSGDSIAVDAANVTSGTSVPAQHMFTYVTRSTASSGLILPMGLTTVVNKRYAVKFRMARKNTPGLNTNTIRIRNAANNEYINLQIYDQPLSSTLGMMAVGVGTVANSSLASTITKGIPVAAGEPLHIEIAFGVGNVTISVNDMDVAIAEWATTGVDPAGLNQVSFTGNMLISKFQVVERRVDVNTLFIGDSIQAGTLATAMQKMGRNLRTIRSVASGGQVIASIDGVSTSNSALDRFATQIATAVNPAARLNIGIIWEGTNDMANSAYASSVITNYGLLLDQMRAAGFNYIVALKPLDRNGIFTGMTRTTFNTQRALLNAQLDAWVGTKLNAVFDPAAGVPNLADATTANFADGVHPTSANYLLLDDWFITTVLPTLPRY